MLASKEQAAAAKQVLSNVMKGFYVKSTIRRELEKVSEFLDAARRKLPSEAAYEKEKKRSKKPKAPAPGHMD